MAGAGSDRLPSRRGFLRLGGAAVAGAALLGVAGCGGGQTTSGGGRTIEHKYGATEVPDSPERIVTVGYTDHDPVLALGAAPVAVREWLEGRAVWPWAEDELGGATPERMPSTQINFEQIATTGADLIIGVSSGMTGDQYETLSEIAPTLPQSGEYVNFGVPWQDQTRVIGRALSREEQAGELVSGVESRFAAAREAHPEFEGATGVVVAPGEGGTYYPYTPQDARGRFLTSLGFEIPEEIAELAGDRFYANISGERLGLIDTDVLIWLVRTEAEREAIQREPLYGELAAPKEGRDIFLGTKEALARASALSFSTVLSLPFLLDELVPMIAAALDGDPETGVNSQAAQTRTETQ